MLTRTRATVEDLYRVPENGKAELVNGEIVHMSPTGARPSRAGGRVYASLLRYEDEADAGCAFPDNAGFIVDLPNRESFSPDAAWLSRDPDELDMRFVEGAPDFAVEVRSKEDYGPAAERSIEEKIRDYFAAGTQVVWDVDLLGEAVVRKHVASQPGRPTIYRRGEVADAEPAVPGWRFPVDSLFQRRRARTAS